MQSQPGGAPPVFVDRTGRRRRLSILAGTAMGLGLLTSLGLIAAGLFSGSSVPLPGWPDGRVQQPIEAGVEGPEGAGTEPTPGSRPSPVTSTSPVVRPSASSTTAGPGVTTATSQPSQPSSTGRPGQGDERSGTVKPSKSPGKPG